MPSSSTPFELASPPIASSSSPSSSSSSSTPSRRIIASVPMRRSPASMGSPHNPRLHHHHQPSSPAPASLAMSRSNSSAPRRIPAPLPMPIAMGRSEPYGGVSMGRDLPYGGVAMERSKASLGTDYNPFYLRQSSTPRSTPIRAATPTACPLPMPMPNTPTLLPSPPASPTTPTPMSGARGRVLAVAHPNRTKELALRDETNFLVKRGPLTPRAFPVGAFPESPRSVRPRRRRGLSAPPPHHLRSNSTCAALLVATDGTKSLRVAPRGTCDPTVRALPFHNQYSEPMWASLVRGTE